MRDSSESPISKNRPMEIPIVADLDGRAPSASGIGAGDAEITREITDDRRCFLSIDNILTSSRAKRDKPI